MSPQILYPSPIEAAISRIESLLDERWQNIISGRSMALLLLQKDPTLRSQLQQEAYFPEIERIVAETEASMSNSLIYEIAESRHLYMAFFVGTTGQQECSICILQEF